jgi:hypothetical protein
MSAAGLSLRSAGLVGRVGVSSGPGSVPPPEAGYNLWLAPESHMYSDEAGTTLATPGGEVKYWEDLSGSGNHLLYRSGIINCIQGPKLDSSLNGWRTLLFGGTAQQSTGLITQSNVSCATGGFAVFFVSRFLVTSGQQDYGNIFGYNGQNWLLRANGSGSQMFFYNSSTGAIIQDWASGGEAWKVFGFRFNKVGSDDWLWRDGIPVLNCYELPNDVVPGLITLGHRQDDVYGSHLSGSIAEVIFYPFPMGSEGMEAVCNYLKGKYGIA